MNTALIDLMLQFKDKKITVLGDFILDHFIHGETNRISPEAPVPVIDVQYQQYRLGGAANVAANLASLGATVYLCAIVGEDIFEAQVKPLLNQHHIHTNYLVRDDNRKTIVKTRLVAQEHTLIRFDTGEQSAITEAAEALLIDLLEEAYLTSDGILIADYEKGVVTKHIISVLKQLQVKHPKFIAVDSKRLDVFRDLHPTLIKPNYKQALQLLNMQVQENRVAHAQSLLNRIQQKTHAQRVALTLDADGAVWAEKGKEPLWVQAIKVKHADVCGAGDTYISAASLALIAGADSGMAAKIAGTAAACVIEKSDTAVCNLAEIMEKMKGQVKAIGSLATLVDIVVQLRSDGKKVVFTNGCFDILHCGHTRYLQEARNQGDVLIVGINTDESVKRIKGAGRPINPLQDRMDVLEAFSSVDYIISFGDEFESDNPAKLIELLKPDVVVKGENYEQKDLPEWEMIKAIGAQLILLPFTHGTSTTHIIRRIQSNSERRNLAKLKAL